MFVSVEWNCTQSTEWTGRCKEVFSFCSILVCQSVFLCLIGTETSQDGLERTVSTPRTILIYRLWQDHKQKSCWLWVEWKGVELWIKGIRKHLYWFATLTKARLQLFIPLRHITSSTVLNKLDFWLVFSIFTLNRNWSIWQTETAVDQENITEWHKGTFTRCPDELPWRLPCDLELLAS